MNNFLQTIKCTIYISLLFFSFLPKNSFSQNRGYNNEIEVEKNLEDRIKPLAQRLDSDAIVRVNVRFKKISTSLPGTAWDSVSIQDNEISSVRVTVFTHQQELPDWLISEINSVVPGLRPQIQHRNFGQEKINSPEKNQDSNLLIKEALDSWGQQNQKNSLLMMIGLAGLLLLGLLASAFIAYSIQRRKSLDTHRLLESRLIPALQNLNVGEGSSNSRPTVLQATLSAPAGGFSSGHSSSNSSNDWSYDTSSIKQLSLKSLEALMSDCYWCQQDSYAAWLWSMMSPEQRNSLFNSKIIVQDYLQWIQALPREKKEDHLNPIYLNPPSLHHVSQHDLARWTEKNPEAFNALSPMRQITLPLSLKTRLDCLSESARQKTHKEIKIEKESVARNLPRLQQFGELSYDDETTLLHNPHMVEEQLKPQIRSLVWLALRPLDYRQKILEQYTAEALASAWSGAEETLARLSEALPEKKRKILEGYLEFIEINKKGNVYHELVKSGLDSTHIKNESQTTNLKAA
jgi:hypothetical protein